MHISSILDTSNARKPGVASRSVSIVDKKLSKDQPPSSTQAAEVTKNGKALQNNRGELRYAPPNRVHFPANGLALSSNLQGRSDGVSGPRSGNSPLTVISYRCAAWEDVRVMKVKT